MRIGQPRARLHAGEIGGVARGGKHEIVSVIAANREGVATDETGLDYRALTKALLLEGVVKPDMPELVIESRVLGTDKNALIDLLARKSQLIADIGKTSLYLPDVDETVSKVSQIPPVRDIIKAGFQQRIEAVRDSGDFHFLLVDGRNLGPVVAGVDDVQLCMRAYVQCNAAEGALRKTDAAGIDITTAEGEAFYVEALAAVRSRNKRDRNRPVDPVRPDHFNSRVSYWMEPWEISDTVELIEARGGNIERLNLADQTVSSYPGLQFIYAREPAAVKAATSEGAQLYFDTAPFRMAGPESLAAMQQAALDIYDEAMATVLVH